MVAGLVVLWPSGPDPKLSNVYTSDTERAEVVSVERFSCAGVQTETCEDVTIRLESGPDRGRESVIQNVGTGGPVPPGLDPGEQLRVARVVGTAEGQPAEYTLIDYERKQPMLGLAVIFATLVIVLGRLRGALSLAGLALSLLIVLVFIVPAILDGSDPLVVSIVGSLAVMVVTLALAHGLNPKSLAALLGITASLLLVAMLAEASTELTNLTGLSSEESSILVLNDVIEPGSLQGLLLAGMVIGALGVLDDVAVSQASTVIALRRTGPSLGFGELYRRAIEVGRDHVSATVNTLVLAYVGASLPTLLVLTSNDIGLSEGINFEVVAEEVVAMLVGSIGLIAAVPLTTALTALLAIRSQPGELGDAQPHAHAH